MPLFRIDATSRGLMLHGTRTPALGADLDRAAAGAKRVVVMVHGYKYSPFHAGHDPHAKLFAAPRWPEAFGAGRPDTLIIAFGWHARGSLRKVHDRAMAEAAGLAHLLAALRHTGRPVDLVAHSLGATVALAALPYLASGDVGRILLLNAAAHRCLATHALASPAGRAAEPVHVTSRENAIFDLLFEHLVPGVGALRGAARIPTLLIDSDRTRARLAMLGFPIGAPDRAISHWSSYTRSGVMALNAALLEGRLALRDLPQAPDTGQAWRRTALALARQSGIIRVSAAGKAPPNEPAY